MRTIGSGLGSLLDGSPVPCALFARVTMDDGVYAVADTADSFDLGGVTYHGISAALQVNPPGQNVVGRPQGGSVVLSAQDEALMAGVFDEAYRGRKIETGFLFQTEEWLLEKSVLSHTKQELGAGDVKDPSKRRVSKLTAFITALSAILGRKGTRRRTDADQRKYRDPDDGFFKNVALSGIREINFGREGASTPARSSPASDS